MVAKLIDKQEPSADEIAKNLDQTRDQILEQKRQQVFEIFANNVFNEYKKSNRVRINAKSQSPLPGQ